MHKNGQISILLLWFLIGSQSVSGLGGEILLIVDPSGSMMQMPATIMQVNIFSDFLIQGFILSLLLGVFPAIPLVGLIQKKRDRHHRVSTSGSDDIL